ncbi:hypothetical protein BU15DRAFT_63543 [Melanogaster broomeanus]|nr:hypothetical protein BU15DRAFT_63543 [Melanogaster broomeanus]
MQTSTPLYYVAVREVRGRRKHSATSRSRLYALSEEIWLSVGCWRAFVTVLICSGFPSLWRMSVLVDGFHGLLALIWLRTGCDIRRMVSNLPNNFLIFGELLDGILTDDVVRLLDDQQMATPQHYFDASRGGAVLAATLFAPSVYLRSGISSLCVTSCSGSKAVRGSVWRIVEYLDLGSPTIVSPAVHPRTNKEDKRRIRKGNDDRPVVRKMAMYRPELDPKRTLGFRTPPPRLAPAIIESNRPSTYWISTSSNNPLISLEDLAINYALELPPHCIISSFSPKTSTKGAKAPIDLMRRTFAVKESWTCAGHKSFTSRKECSPVVNKGFRGEVKKACEQGKVVWWGTPSVGERSGMVDAVICELGWILYILHHRLQFFCTSHLLQLVLHLETRMVPRSNLVLPLTLIANRHRIANTRSSLAKLHGGSQGAGETPHREGTDVNIVAGMQSKLGICSLQ